MPQGNKKALSLPNDFISGHKTAYVLAFTHLQKHKLIFADGIALFHLSFKG